MLYELDADFTILKPVKFHSFAEIAKKEKHLENLLSEHLFDTLFEQTPLLPFHQEVPYEAVADIYALNQNGDVVIFELKRHQAATGALDQLLRYAEESGLWSYSEIERRYRNYIDNSAANLKADHRNAFNLDTDHQLHETEFNREQHLWVVGNAADDQLIRSVDFWKSKGLSIDFFPYRIYQLEGKSFFEFFAKPYDRHVNPAYLKGVLFDTNRSWDYLKGQGGYGCLRDMLQQKRVAAYGDRKDAVMCLQPGDYVFYSHVGWGVVGAAKVKGRKLQKVAHEDYEEEWYWDVELLTPVPEDFEKNMPVMSFGEVRDFLNKNFFWARIDKYPYLTIEESERLLAELQTVLNANQMPNGTLQASEISEKRMD